MITYGTADNVGYLAFRVAESVLGAVVGLAVNVLVLPPLRLREGDRAVAAAATEIAEQLRTIAEGLRAGWSEHDARHWHREAVAVERAVRDAEEIASDGRESAWLNPRTVLRRRRGGPGHGVLGTLYEVADQTRHLTKILAASNDPDSVPRTDPVFDRELAGLLTDVATALDTYREAGGRRRPDLDAVRAALRRAGGAEPLH